MYKLFTKPIITLLPNDFELSKTSCTTAEEGKDGMKNTPYSYTMGRFYRFRYRKRP